MAVSPAALTASYLNRYEDELLHMEELMDKKILRIGLEQGNTISFRIPYKLKDSTIRVLKHKYEQAGWKKVTIIPHTHFWCSDITMELSSSNSKLIHYARTK